MKPLIKLAISVVFITFILSIGCSGKPIRVGVIEQQDNINIDFTSGRSIEASASGLQLLLFLPVFINDRHERAYTLLRAQADRDYITDIKVQESWSYAFIGTIYKTTIKAMAYRQD